MCNCNSVFALFECKVTMKFFERKSKYIYLKILTKSSINGVYHSIPIQTLSIVAFHRSVQLKMHVLKGTLLVLYVIWRTMLPSCSTCQMLWDAEVREATDNLICNTPKSAPICKQNY